MFLSFCKHVQQKSNFKEGESLAIWKRYLKASLDLRIYGSPWIWWEDEGSFGCKLIMRLYFSATGRT